MKEMKTSELQDLVDAPNERLDVEYKAWLDLGDRAVQADLAKHVSTLASYGSGYIVFGIADDMTSAGEGPPDDWEELVIAGNRRGGAGPKG